MKQKTYEKLNASLIKIIQNTPYEEITVKLLCNEANITRKTFYNNYKSIDEFVKNIFINMFYEKCYSKINDESYFESTEFILTMIDIWNEYDKLFLALDKWNILEYFMKNNINNIIELIKEQFKDIYISKYKEYFIVCTYGNIANVCLTWLKKGKLESKEELEIIIKRFIYHQDNL